MLEASAEAGVSFYDTADVYGDGRSERIVGRFVAAHPDAGCTVATKMGRRAEQIPDNYVEANFRSWIDRSRRNLAPTASTLSSSTARLQPWSRATRRTTSWTPWLRTA